MMCFFVVAIWDMLVPAVCTGLDTVVCVVVCIFDDEDVVEG